MSSSIVPFGFKSSPRLSTTFEHGNEATRTKAPPSTRLAIRRGYTTFLETHETYDLEACWAMTIGKHSTSPSPSSGNLAEGNKEMETQLGVY